MLIAVLLIVVLLAVILVEFNYESRVNLHIAYNCYRSQQTLNYAEAGINIAVAAVRQHADIRADESVRRLLSGAVQVPIADGYCTVSVEEENGRININQLRAANGRIARRRVDQLLRLVDIVNRQYGQRSPIGYGIAPAIIDWVDADDEVTVLPFVERENEGAESDYYERLEFPYACKDAPFDTLNELLLVRGMTREIFEGRPGDKSEGIKPIDGVRQFLTIYGDGKIDINHAPAEVIQSLSDRIDARLAQAIVEQRELAPFRSPQELQTVPGITPEVYSTIRELVVVNPQTRYYKVTATGVVQEYTRKIRVTLRRDRSSGKVTLLLRQEL